MGIEAVVGVVADGGVMEVAVEAEAEAAEAEAEAAERGVLVVLEDSPSSRSSSPFESSSSSSPEMLSSVTKSPINESYIPSSSTKSGS